MFLALVTARFSAPSNRQFELLSLAESGKFCAFTRPLTRENSAADPAPRRAGYVPPRHAHGGHHRFTIGEDRRKKGGCYGYDGGKQVAGRKRFALVDTLGLLLAVLVLPANTGERAGAQKLLVLARKKYPMLQVVWADGGYDGIEFLEWCATVLSLTILIVSKPLGIKTFLVLPRRWVVERTFGWWGKFRRLSRDYETKPVSSESWIQIAMLSLMAKRLRPK